eukprot:TRINITY_DN10228_c0_g1_i8.p1 TRINITY_DN10228_c0_g1~~TRINITY_DN10228_c0_g1_i8.p1  ORF type:complete len:135 (+),score=22.29 TRINITY_DN10228_c0_g1_i8:133-537(+)
MAESGKAIQVEGAYMELADGNAAPVAAEGAYLDIGKASAVTTEEGYIAVVEGGAKSGQKRVDMNFTENAARHGADPELLATESLYDPRTLDSNAPVTTEDAYDPRTLEGLAPGGKTPAPHPTGLAHEYYTERLC